MRDAQYNVFHNAPSLVFIVGKNNYPFFLQDCSLAAAYFMLAATNRDLGTCWIGLGEYIEDLELRKKIALPRDYHIASALSIGYPELIPTMAPRKEPQILSIV